MAERSVAQVVQKQNGPDASGRIRARSPCGSDPGIQPSGRQRSADELHLDLVQGDEVVNGIAYSKTFAHRFPSKACGAWMLTNREHAIKGRAMRNMGRGP